MSRKQFNRPRQAARARAYGPGPLRGKQAAAVEEALRQQGVMAHVKPTRTGDSMLVRVLDPEAQPGYLDAHAAALADALGADWVTIYTTRDFIIAPQWHTPEGIAEEVDENARWLPVDSRACSADEPLAPAEESPSVPPARPDGATQIRVPGAGAGFVAVMAAYIDGYRLGRLAGVLGDLRPSLVIGGPHRDGSFELRLAAGRDSAAVRTRLHGLSAAIAAALGAAACRIEGRGRRITITPLAQSPAEPVRGA